MKNALNNQVGMLGDMFLWIVANLKQGVIYFIKQALPPNISAGSVGWPKERIGRLVVRNKSTAAQYQKKKLHNDRMTSYLHVETKIQKFIQFNIVVI